MPYFFKKIFAYLGKECYYSFGLLQTCPDVIKSCPRRTRRMCVLLYVEGMSKRKRVQGEMRMNEVITKLYEMEETAGRILADAQRYKERLTEQKELEQRAMEKELERELSMRLEEEEKRLRREAEEKIRQLELGHNLQMQELDKMYDGHFKELSEEIFQRITEV